MKFGKRLWACLILIVVAFVSACFFAGCEGEGETESGNSGTTPVLTNVYGTYYCEVGDDEWDVTLKNDGTYVISMNGNDTTGSYDYYASSNKLELYNASYSASYDLTKLAVVIGYDGNTYTFLKKVDYTVTFETNGGSAVEAKTVVNGKAVEAPAEPTMAGKVFIGWYKEAALSNLFAFKGEAGAEAVYGNTTLYARFEDEIENAATYTVTFDLAGKNGTAPAARQTKNERLYILPKAEAAGETFLGWYRSDYDTPDMLTAEYKGEKLNGDTTLYAAWANNGIYVSATENAIEWTSVGVNAKYSLKIENETYNKTVLLRSDLGMTREDFEFTEEGEYVITVTSGTTEGKAYLKYHVLPEPALTVNAEAKTLNWAPVPNATNYYITADCENDDHYHEHEAVDGTSFDFSDCGMLEDGITFTVYAEAEGYVGSFASITYSAKLEEVRNITVNSESLLSWSSVPNAEEYVVTITFKKANTESAPDYVQVIVKAGEPLQYDLKFYDRGQIDVTVVARAKGYNPSEEKAYQYDKVKIASPSNVAFEGESVTWEPVEGAVSYLVEINGKTYQTEGNELVLDDQIINEDITKYEIKVQAIAENPTENSSYSNTETLSYTFEEAYYANGRLNWLSYFGALKYNVYYNGTKIAETTDNYYVFDFDNAGDNTVGVSCVTEKGESDVLTVTVETFEIKLDTTGGVQVNEENENVTVEYLYYVTGDTFRLPTDLVKRGYTFTGWSNVKGGPAAGGIVCDGTTFMGGDITVYAFWTAKKYEVNINYTDDEAELLEVTYDEMFGLPVATTTDVTLAFAGWYSEKNGVGTRYTDETGASMRKWTTDNMYATQLYPRWVPIFNFEETTLNNEKGYMVEKANGIEFVTEITIPAYYNDLPVLYLSNAAFKDTKNLQVINIPDTIYDCSESGSAFTGCDGLKAVNVYYVEGAHERYYASEQGVLFYNNDYNGIEMVLAPLSMEGTLVIPSHVTFNGQSVAVTTLPTEAFKNSKLSKIVIPYTISKIDAGCFDSAANLIEIEFEATPDGEPELELTVAKGAFNKLTNLLSITFPTRMTEFKPEAIEGCTSLQSINIAGKGGNYSSVGGVLTNANKSVIIYVPAAFAGTEGVYEIPLGITEIGPNAFTYNTGVENLIVSAWVTKIGEEAFAKRSTTGALTSNTVLLSVTFMGGKDDPTLTIDELAFYYCTKLETVTLSGNVRVVKANAFGYTSSLTVVYVESSGNVQFEERAFGSFTTTATAAPTYYVTDLYIGKETGSFAISGVFGPSKLSKIEIDPENENFVSINNIVYDKAVEVILYVPGEFAGEYETPATLKEIGAGAFNGRTGLTKVTIAASVEKIGADAFYGCTGLKQIVFEETAEGETPVSLELGQQAFRGCSQITSFVLPERLTKLGAAAFFSCSALESVTLPSTLNEIEYGYQLLTVSNEQIEFNYVDLFESCTNFKSLTVAEGNTTYTTINNVLYKLNRNGEPDVLMTVPRGYTGDDDGKIVIPATVSKINTRAFYYSNINEISFAEGTGDIEVEPYAFYYAYTTKIELPVGITTISPRMFYYAEYITELTIPYTVERIGYNAFYYCMNLERINFQETPEGEQVRTLTFEDAKLPGAASSSSSYATFYYCKVLKEINFPERTNYIGSYCCYYATYYELAKVTIPSTVTEIGEYAFYYSSATVLSDVTFATRTEIIGGEEVQVSDLNKIGKYAFGYAAISEISLPDSVTEIGERAFYYCKSLSSIKLPAKLEKIGEYAFYYCSALDDVHVPASVKQIDTYAFAYTTAMKNITFEVDKETGLSRLEKMGTYMFTSSGISSFTFPETAVEIVVGTADQKRIFSSCKSLTRIGFSSKTNDITDLFYNCTSIKEFDVPEENPYFSELPGYPILMNHEGTTVRLCVDINGALSLPEGVIEIGPSAFYGITGLNTLSLPTTINKIGVSAFEGCTGLQKVEFRTDGNGNTNFAEFGNRAFYGCTNLVSLRLPATASVETFPQYLFHNCSKLEDFVFPAMVNKVETYALYNCSSILLKNLPSQIKYIGKYSFYKVGLERANINAEMVLEEYAFAYANSLIYVNIEEGIKKLPNYAFYYCQALKSITIPYSVEELGNCVFYYCTELQNVEFATNDEGKYGITKVGYELFYHTDALRTIFLPGTIEYVVGTSYSTAGSSGGLFYYSGVEEVTFGKGLNVIPAYAFAYTKNITKIDIPVGVTEIGNDAFYYSALGEVTIPYTVEKIGNYAFTGPSSTTSDYVSHLKSINFQETPEGETPVELRIGTYFAEYTFDLEEITLPERLTFDKVGSSTSDPGYYAFYYSGVKKINLPDNLKILPYYFLYYASNVTELTLPSSLEQIGAYSLGYLGIEKITIPSSVKSIGNYAFTYAKALSEVNFAAPAEGETAEDLTVGTYTFNYCTALESITLPDRLKIAATSSAPTSSTAGAYMFYHSGILNVKFGAGVEALGYYMFGYTPMESIEIPATVKVMGPYALAYNYSLASVTFEDRTEQLKMYGSIFYNDSLITEIDLPDTVKFLSATGTSYSTEGYQLFYGTSISEFTIPTSWTAIPYGMFYYTKLKSISIPSSITAIGSYAFYGCADLEEVIFENRGTKALTIKGSVFTNDTKLKEIELPSGVKYTAVGTSATADGANMLKNTAISEFTIPSTWSAVPYGFLDGTRIKSINIPATVTAIGTYAFENCYDLETVTFATRTKALTIGGSIFMNDSKLTSLSIPDGTKGVTLTSAQTADTGAGSGLFAGTGITEFTIPTSWTAITYRMFDGSKLKKITIPATVKNIGSYAFRNCYDLEEVTFANRTSSQSLTVNGSIFQNDSKITSITLPSALKFTAVGTSATASGANLLAGTSISEFTVPTGWEYIPYGLLTGTKISKITIPASVKGIGTYAFKDCTELTEVTFENPNSTATFGGGVFMGTTSLKAVDLPTGISITAVGSGASAGGTTNGAAMFMNSAVEEIVLPAGVKALTAQMFSGATNLRKLTVLGDLTATFNSYYIDYSTESYRPYATFYGCENLEEVIFEGNVTLSSYLFRALHTEVPMAVTFNGTVNDIGTYAFAYMDGIKSVTFNGLVKKTTYSAFYQNHSLEEVTFNGEVVELGYQSFYQNDNLKTVNFNGNVGTIGYNAFRESPALENVNFNYDVDLIKYSAFYGDDGLKEVTFAGDLGDVEYYVFYNCHNLEKVTFKGEVGRFGTGTTQGQAFSTGPTYTGYHIFTNCRSLADVIFEGKVGTIGACAFFNCRGLVNLKFYDDVDSIGDYAFSYDTSLESVAFNNVFNVGNYAFYRDESLQSVTYDNILSYGNYCFAETSLKSFSLPATYTISSVYDNVGLFYMSDLESFVLPANVTVIPNEFFSGCKNLTELTFLGQITQIGDAALSGTGITSFVIPETVTSIGNEAMLGMPITALNIPKSVTSIGNGAFGKCLFDEVTVDADNTVYAVNDDGDLYNKLTGDIMMVLPNTTGEYTVKTGVKYAPQAFQGTLITKIVIEPGMTEVVDYAFYDMPELTEVVLPMGITRIGNYAFAGCEKLTTISKVASLEEIGTYAFADTGFATVNVEGNVSSLGAYAFAGCKNLTTVNIGESVESFGQYLFADCDALENVNFLGNRTAIYGALATTDLYMFAQCDGQITLSMPATLTDGGRSMFRNCTAEKVTLAEGTPAVLGYMFYYAKVHEIVLPESLHTYGGYAFEYWAPYEDDSDNPTSKLTVKGNVEDTGNYLLYHASMNTVEFAEGVTSIDTTAHGTSAAYGFLYYGYMKNVVFPSTLETLNAPYFMYYGLEETIDLSKTKITSIPHDFAYTSSTQNNPLYETLISVKLPDTVTYIGNYAFEYQRNLVEINWPASLEEIGNYAFGYCSSLPEVVLPETLKKIGTYAFMYCDGATYVKLPASLESTGTYAFEYMRGLKEAEIACDLAGLGNDMFYYCTALEKVTFTGKLTAIPNYTFYHCDSLVDITLPDTLESIGSDAFAYCGSLYNLKLPSSLKTLGTYAFAYITTTPFMVIPASVTEIGNYAFTSWTAQQTVYFEADEVNMPTLGASWAGGTRNVRMVVGSKGPVYLDATLWDAEDASERFAAYMFNADSAIWVNMNNTGTGKYMVDVPNGYDSIIFVRMNGEALENDWMNKWNQTADLTIAGNYGLTYTITAWGDNGVSEGYWN